MTVVGRLSQENGAGLRSSKKRKREAKKKSHEGEKPSDWRRFGKMVEKQGKSRDCRHPCMEERQRLAFFPITREGFHAVFFFLFAVRRAGGRRRD